MQKRKLATMELRNLSDSELLNINGGGIIGNVLKAAGKVLSGPVGVAYVILSEVPDFIDGFKEGWNSVPPAK